MPTQQAAPARQQNPIALKNLVRQAERVLTPDDDANIPVGSDDINETDLGLRHCTRRLAWTRPWAA